MQVIRVQSTDSTLDEARRRIRAGVSPPIAVVAEQQTAGRGRKGTPWRSPSGGVWLTVSVAFDAPPPNPLPLRVALAVVGAVESYASGHRRGRLGLGIKWPNDILLDGRKLAGILCEYERPLLHIGIGINADMTLRDLPDELAQTATTLRDRLGERVDPAALCDGVLERIDDMLGTPGAPVLADDEYHEIERILVFRGCAVRIGPMDDRAVKAGTRDRTEGMAEGTTEGMFVGIDRDGAAVLQTPRGVQRLVSGSLLPASDAGSASLS